MSAFLLMLLSLPARAADACDVRPDPDAPLRVIQTEQLPALVSEHKGCVVLLELYASWCGTCTRTAAAVSELAGRLQPEGLVMVGASVDASAEKLSAWRQTHGREYAPVIIEGWSLDGLTAQLAAMGATFSEAIPLFVLFDADGNAVMHLTEPADLSALEARARALL